MSTKRQRVRSSIQGEVRVFNQVLTNGSPDGFLERKPIEAAFLPVETKKQKEEALQRRSIFTVGPESPEREEQKKKQSGEGFLEFLDKCRLCNKQTILHYMYGYLGAYCSIDCREAQMALDKFDEQIAKESPIFKASRKPNCAS